MRIYLAGPLFCNAETAFNARLAEKLEVLGFSVFLPQRDGAESWALADEELTLEALRQKYYTGSRSLWQRYP